MSMAKHTIVSGSRGMYYYSLCANRQIIVEFFPPDHRGVLGRLDRQIIVEIGGGNEPSSSLERTLGTADASPCRKRPEVG